MSSGGSENTGNQVTLLWSKEQKENWPGDVVRKIPKTPKKHELALQIVNCQGDRTPTKPQCGEDEPWVTPKRRRSTSPWSTKAGTDPLTPTANLKMLISAASPEIRNLENRKKVLFRRLDNVLDDESSQDTFFGEEFERSTGSRKEKSLGLLCLKFLARYPNYPASTSRYTISLDEVAAELSVERRRIYDIVNVLESLDLVSRAAKNRYSWNGRHKLPSTLALLRQAAQQQGFAALANRFQDGDAETCTHDDSNTHSQMELKRPPKAEFSSLQQDKRPKPSGGRKDKSLKEMSKKFVMLFLVVRNNVVSLEMAAKVLQGGSQFDVRDNCKLKTKIRRLYDIANVLTSLSLIKKVQVMEDRGRKPAFQWVGPENLPEVNEFAVVNAVPVQLVTATVREAVAGEVLSVKVSSPKVARRVPRDGFVRHSSFQTSSSGIEAEHRKISSAPCSPIKRHSDACCLGLNDLSRMDQLATICKLHLEAQPSEGVASQNLRQHAKPLSEAQAPTGKVQHTASVSQAQVVSSTNSVIGRVAEQNGSSPPCEYHEKSACGLEAKVTSQQKVKQPSLNPQAPSTAKIQAACENNMVFINGFQPVGYINSIPFTSVTSPQESGQGKANGLKAIPNQYYYISPPAGSHPMLAFCSPTLAGIRMQQGIQLSPSACSPLTLIKPPLSPQSNYEETLKPLSPALQAHQGQPFTIIMHSPQAGTPKSTHIPNMLVDHLFRTPGELRLGLAPAVPVRTGPGGGSLLSSSRGEPSLIPQRRLNLDDS
uniref:Transcription factor E2F8-like n=1 Tax=Petromyzon marinus TaxID=7757 RepID=A0AAJ7SUV9_PETMA|nr:transcription factor E2F8-like [Petromyzon marinus]XP_032804933.1 transcription factor E2F8-like [Petromyzon marinus]